MTFDGLPAALAHWIASEVPKLEGWLSPEQAAQMAELVVRTKPAVAVEIGVFGGRAVLTHALAMQHIGHGQIFGIDPWKTDAACEGYPVDHQAWWAAVDWPKIFQGAAEGIWRNKVEQRAVLIRARSEHCVTLFREIDILCIDGNHSEESSCRDVANYLPLLRPGGYLWFDDPSSTTMAALGMIEAKCERVLDAWKYRLYQKRA